MPLCLNLNPFLPGLDDSRKEVGHRGSGAGHHRRGLACGPAMTQSPEAEGALVDADVETGSRVHRDSQGQGGGAGS